MDVDFYFDFSSTNSYFAAMLLPDVARRYGAGVRWLPIHLASLFRGTGFDVMAMPRRKARYLWRDHERYAEWTGLPFRKPSRFPIKTSAVLRSVLAAPQVAPGRPGIDGELAQAIFRAYWERDENVADAGVIGAAARSLGLDADRLLAAADAPEARERLAALTTSAIERGVFGAPTFFVGDEMFWGKDRLDFVERWLARRRS